MGHLHTLKTIIDKRWMTALILENDADWDIEIKKQLALVAPHIRAVTNSTSHGQPQPYGSTWDLLWLGHCGDGVPPTGVVSIFDSTLPEEAAYRENTGE
ncbi:glycosyltransferase family 25 protein [Thermothelomyces thermophilus ATCC 42464]|uniref:Glycosyltransferase family 25 protein n=1 Tax=Thermothelomyces thermophilus (strain ATCC 42464 / BCRC 31852 / DSM 1799) TaxID=573729 RepID=G2QJV3_THET4|nr:glycosyltransferase family 25 protein [Thermothelomyces thermophilus ATCC 42464]AEO59859.1 glycosyltransferase family 25 protein [Thermothelomyces thermophilus ATCC 42464]